MIVMGLSADSKYYSGNKQLYAKLKFKIKIEPLPLMLLRFGMEWLSNLFSPLYYNVSLILFVVFSEPGTLGGGDFFFLSTFVAMNRSLAVAALIPAN
jgi:hypothetical protein